MSAEYVSGKLTRVCKYDKVIAMNLCNREIRLDNEEKKKIRAYWEQKFIRKGSAVQYLCPGVL